MRELEGGTADSDAESPDSQTQARRAVLQGGNHCRNERRIVLAVPIKRHHDRTARHGNAGNQNPRTLDGTQSGTPQYSRPRDGRNPVGTAVPRGTGPTGGSGVFIPAGYYGGLYPFGYGYYGDPYGYYGGYYGGYYDPWYGGYPSSGQTSYGQTDEEGALRLKVKPKEAEVYVDGYYVGIVDDFNGVFQKLHLETGVHRLEIRAPGYEPLTFDVRITAGHKSTYEGELKRIP